MKRKIIKIDNKKCNGCGLCANACHEGAISMVDGRAVLLRDDYCDGLGDCLPVCPTGAISFEEREAAPYDEEAVRANMQSKREQSPQELPCGCPSSHSKAIKREQSPQELPCGCPGSHSKAIKREQQQALVQSKAQSRLSQWPVQIKLVPVNAPYFEGANLLIAADCAAYAYAGFHEEFIKNHITLIGCPKLDMVEYATKLTEIIKNNGIKSVRIVRMQVPCCGGIENAAKEALRASGKLIPWQVYTISTDGEIIE